LSLNQISFGLFLIIKRSVKIRLIFTGREKQRLRQNRLLTQLKILRQEFFRKEDNVTYEYREIEPETLGYIKLEKVKCGKPNCHCAKGKKHKAYYLYFRDCAQRNENGKMKLIKKYIPKSLVKNLKRKIQLRKNKDNLNRLFGSNDDALMFTVWQKLKDLPRSKILERLHTEIKRAKNTKKYQYLTQKFKLLR
jgi:hypothetical protein